MENNPSSSRTDRKTIEKNRRNHMKTLYSKLNSLVPHHTSQEMVSLPDQLYEATNYIKELQTTLEKMKKKKERLMGNDQKPMNASLSGGGVKLRSPQIEIHQVGSALEVVLITGLDCQFMFNETIRIIHEDGVEVVNASFSVIDDTVFHTIHSQIGKSAPDNAAARISERLKMFVNGVDSF